MENYLATIVMGTLVGTISRTVLIRLDYRQYPGYPHGYISHLAQGFIASALGAVAVPAILKPDFTAFTFLALAAQQFREIRNIERKALENLEAGRLIKRGSDYIEGIARTFEARNYLVMLTAFFTALAHELGGMPASVGMGTLFIFFSRSFMAGETIGDICEVLPARLHFKGTLLKVDDVDIMTVGLKKAREKILADGLGVIIVPKDEDARATIGCVGQRTAIAHTAAVILGVKKDVDTPEFTPLARKHLDSGNVALFIVPAERDMDALIAAVKRTPVLESARTRPLKTQAGRMAAGK